MLTRTELLRLLVSRGIMPAEAERLLDEVGGRNHQLWDEQELADLADILGDDLERAREWVAYSPDVPNTSRRLWTALALATGALALYRGLRAYVWDAERGRYIDSAAGTDLNPVQVTTDLRAIHDVSTYRFVQLTADAIAGKLDYATLERVLAQELKNLYNANTALAWGGWARTPDAAWARNAEILRGEYRYLAGFIRDLADGKLTAEQASMRIELYVGKAFSRYWDEQQRMYAELGVYAEYRWLDSSDERECFPAWTSVETGRGAIPIQKVRTGDVVLTRNGWRRVSGTYSKTHKGGMTRLKVGRSTLISTQDHPIWLVGEGWCEAGNVDRGALLYSFKNESVKVRSAKNFLLGDANDLPSVMQKVGIFLGISLRVSVPVNAVNFEGYALGVEKEVNTVTPESSFLNELSSDPREGFAHSRFDSGFSSISPVTSDATESLIEGRNDSDGDSTLKAGHVLRGPAAFLRAKFASPSIAGLRASVDFATAGTRLVDSISHSAFSTANRVSMRLRNIYLEGLTTFRAYFLDALIGFVLPFAFTGAKLAVPGEHRFVGIERFSTNEADQPFSAAGSRMVTGITAIPILLRGFALSVLKNFPAMMAGICKHGLLLLTDLNVLYHVSLNKQIRVYDLTVERDHEFFANGFLVHNCNDCPILADRGWVPMGSFGTVPGAGDTQCLGACRCELEYR